MSDFLGPLSSVETLARLFRTGKHEVRWFHVLDPAEIDFPYRDWTQFEGLEGEGRLLAHGREASTGYHREIGRWLAEIRDIALQNRVMHTLVRTDEPLTHVLASVAG